MTFSYTSETSQHFEDAKCSAIRNADVFLNGYSETEAKQIGKQWAGCQMIVSHLENLRLIYSSKVYLDPLVNFLADS